MSVFDTRVTRRTAMKGVSAAALAAAWPSLRSTHAQDLTPVTLALDWYENANHAGILVAQAKGYFEEAGLDVDVFVPADPTTVLQTVGAGRDTFGVTYHQDVLFARAEEVPVKSIAAMVQHPLNSVMVLAESDIHSVEDLKGKTIAMAGVPSDEAFLETMLQHAGLELSDVEMVNVGYDLMPAVMSGRADATIGVYWTHETILAEHEGYPVRYFRVEDWGVPDYYELVIVAGEETIASQQEQVTAFLGALRKGYHDAEADPDAALELLLATSEELIPEVEAEGLKLLAPLWTDNGTLGWGTQTAERWDAYTQWNIEQGLIEGGVVAADCWVDLFPEDASATPVATPQ